MRPVRRSARRAAHVIIGVLIAGLARDAGAQEEQLLQELKTVAEVRIEGARHVGKGAIRKAIKTRSPSIWPWRDRPVLRFDYLRNDVDAITELYRHHGFLDARVAYQVSSARRADEVVVIFSIEEDGRSRIREVLLPGVTSYPEKDLRKRLWSRPGRWFDPAYLQLDTLLITTLYQDRGYRPHVLASYARGQPDSLSVTVRYDVLEGARYQVGEITISGHNRVRDELITRELLLRPGSLYQRSRVERSLERLYETGLFSQVQIEPLPDSTHTVMNFDIRLRERRPRWIDAGVGSGTAERFRLTGDWGHRNLLGRGLQGSLGSRLALYEGGEFQLWHVQATLVEPWLLRTRTRGLITPYYERKDERIHQNTDSSAVVRQEFKGLDFELRREINRFTRVTLTQKNLFARQELDLRRVINTATRDSLEVDYTTHRLVLGFERDVRDNPFNPARGSATRVSAEAAGGPLRGTSSFRKVQLSSSWYTPFGNGWVLATRAASGLIDPFGTRVIFSPGIDPEVARVPLEDRFRIGGVNTIRGYHENEIPGIVVATPTGSTSLGGLAMVHGSVELRIPTPVRIPWLGTVGLETYVDAGNVWARPEYLRWEHFTQANEDDPNTVRYVFGIGPRVDLPVGPLRVDVSWRWRPTPSHAIVQFAIGPSF